MTIKHDRKTAAIDHFISLNQIGLAYCADAFLYGVYRHLLRQFVKATGHEPTILQLRLTDDPSLAVSPTPSDTELLDFLEIQNRKGRYTGRAKFRWSTTGRGWRLHETSDGGYFSVRDAIRVAMEEAKGEDQKDY